MALARSSSANAADFTEEVQEFANLGNDRVGVLFFISSCQRDSTQLKAFAFCIMLKFVTRGFDFLQFVFHLEHGFLQSFLLQ